MKGIRALSEKAAIGLILATSLLGRLVAAFFFRGISGGDFFNYLLITKELVSFRSPFIAKRLPFYPLLLIPGHLLGHPIGWAKALGILGGLGSLVVLYLLGRELKIKRGILYLALIFTSFQSTLFIYSLRPLTHTLFTFGVLLSLYLFYRVLDATKSSNGRVLSLLFWGVAMGLMCMTRHEGFLVAVVLLVSFVLFPGCHPEGEVRRISERAKRVSDKLRDSSLALRMTIGRLLPTLIPFLIIVAPYFISNYIRFENPFYSQYTADPGLNRVTDFRSFLINFEKIKWIILNIWGQTGYFPIKWVLIPTVLLILAFVLLRQRFPRKEVLLWVFLTVSLYSLFLIHNSSFTPLAFASFLLACLMVLGGLKFVIETKWLGIPLLSVLVTQTILILFIQPWARHLQHTFPFWVLFLALGMSWLFEETQKIFRWSAIAVLSGLVLFNCYTGVRAGIESHRRGVLPTQPLFEAVEFAKDLEGPIAFESNASWIEYYLGGKARYLSRDLEIPPADESYKKRPAEQWQWIEKNKPKYLVRYNLWDALSLVESEKYRNRFKLVKKFEADRNGEVFEATVYEVKYSGS